MLTLFRTEIFTAQISIPTSSISSSQVPVSTLISLHAANSALNLHQQHRCYTHSKSMWNYTFNEAYYFVMYHIKSFTLYILWLCTCFAVQTVCVCVCVCMCVLCCVVCDIIVCGNHCCLCVRGGCHSCTYICGVLRICIHECLYLLGTEFRGCSPTINSSLQLH